MGERKPLTNDVIPDSVIDAKNLHSPVPLLRLKRVLAGLETDETVRIDCTDPGCAEDIANWCARMNHTYLGEKEHPQYTSYFVTRQTL